MKRATKKGTLGLGIVRAILLAPVVVATGMAVFIGFYVVLLPILSLVQWVRLAADGGFRRKLLGAAGPAPDSEDVYYHPGHTWARLETASVSIGPDEFTNSLVGDGSWEFECASVGTDLRSGDPVWRLRCGNRSLEQVVPISGTIIEVNTKLLRDPSQMARVPVQDLWVVKVRPATAIRDFKELFSVENFVQWNQKVKDRIVARFSPEAGLVQADGGRLIPDLAKVLTDDEWTELVSQEFK